VARVQSAEFRGRLALRFKVRRGFFDVPAVRRTLGETTFRALSKAGNDVREATKRGIGQRAPKKTKKWKRKAGIGRLTEFHGGLYQDITPYGSGKPRPAGQPAKSWAPKRFLYRDIFDYYDRSSKSVVIGPEKAAWLNQLHEFGGTLPLTAYRIGVRAAYIARERRRKGRAVPRLPNGEYNVGGLLWTSRGFRSRNWERTSLTRQVRYPARPYMGSANVQKALAKLPQYFRDKVRGV
jgi:hypothetical protein